MGGQGEMTSYNRGRELEIKRELIKAYFKENYI